MFYQESMIKSVLTCPICKQLFDDPKLLPCGDTFCHECILSLVKSTDDNKQVQCTECSQVHQMPHNGFTSIRLFEQFNKQKPSHVYRGKRVKKLTELLESANEKCNELESSLTNGAD